jgi:DnaJ-class molecular chaperone
MVNPFGVVRSCNECGGKGKVIVQVCHYCGGAKVMDHTAQYTLSVLPGMPEGYEVVFEGEGDQSAEWEAGDVVLKVRSQKQAGDFRRKETSLYWKETIGVDEVCNFSACCRNFGHQHIHPRHFWALKGISLIWTATKYTYSERV